MHVHACQQDEQALGDGEAVRVPTTGAGGAAVPAPAPMSAQTPPRSGIAPAIKSAASDVFMRIRSWRRVAQLTYAHMGI